MDNSVRDAATWGGGSEPGEERVPAGPAATYHRHWDDKLLVVPASKAHEACVHLWRRTPARLTTARKVRLTGSPSVEKCVGIKYELVGHASTPQCTCPAPSLREVGKLQSEVELHHFPRPHAAPPGPCTARELGHHGGMPEEKRGGLA